MKQFNLYMYHCKTNWKQHALSFLNIWNFKEKNSINKIDFKNSFNNFTHRRLNNSKNLQMLSEKSFAECERNYIDVLSYEIYKK